MSMFVRVLTVLAVVAACVAIPAYATISTSANAALSGVTNNQFINNAANPYPTNVNDGQQHGTIYTSPTLNDGTFTIQGAATVYSSGSGPTGLLHVFSMSVSNGNVVISGYFPVITEIQFSGITGTAAANTPMIGMSGVFAGDRLTVEVVDSTVAWSAAETVINSQVLFALPSTLSGSSGVFALGVSVTRASAIVGIPPTSSDLSMVLTRSSVVAVDYVTCTGCENGIVYVPSTRIYVQSNSLLRVSHITFASTAPEAIINAGTGTITSTTGSLIVVENVTALTSNVFGGTVSSSTPNGVVLRYLKVKTVGATLGADTTYTDVAVQSGADSLAGSTQVANACPAACLNGFALTDAALSCNCSCSTAAGSSSTATSYYENFCTVMEDPLADYHLTGCMDGCTWCHNESACNSCSTGFTLNTTTAQCQQTPAACPANCETCSAAGLCTRCVDGYAVSNSGACVRCTVANCKQCSATNPGTCTMCKDDTAPVSNVCTLSCTDTHCASCPSAPGTCVRCADNYGLVNGVCTACTDPNCRQCNGDANSCSACEDGYTWQGTSCSSGSSSCDLTDCEECDPDDSSKCKKCVNGKVEDTVTHLCITSGTCYVANCKTCSSTSASLCKECNADYALSADNTTCTLTTTPEPTTTTTTTTRAPTTTTPLPTASCSVPNCVTCISGNPNACRYCNTNYYTSNGQCVLTSSCYVGNCAQCMLRDSTKCSTCRNGYLLSSTFTCLSQHVNVNGAAAPHSLWLAAAVLVASAITYLA